jgi:hypothetical protein
MMPPVAVAVAAAVDMARGAMGARRSWLAFGGAAFSCCCTSGWCHVEDSELPLSPFAVTDTRSRPTCHCVHDCRTRSTYFGAPFE